MEAAPGAEATDRAEATIGAEATIAELSTVEMRAAEVLQETQRVMKTLVGSYHSMTGLTVSYMDVCASSVDHVTTELASTMDVSKAFMRKCLELDLEMESIDAIALQARLVNEDLSRLELVVDRLCADGGSECSDDDDDDASVRRSSIAAGYAIT